MPTDEDSASFPKRVHGRNVDVGRHHESDWGRVVGMFVRGRLPVLFELGGENPSMYALLVLAVLASASADLVWRRSVSDARKYP